MLQLMLLKKKLLKFMKINSKMKWMKKNLLN